MSGVELVLASGSPRRREMIEGLGVSFTIEPADIDETPWAGEAPIAFAERMAREKGAHIEGYTLAADTVVHLGDEIFGKPVDEDDAVAMLRRLSGRSHEVTTGVAIGSRGEREVFSVTTEVTFRALGEDEIAAYVASGDPLDKAGSYGIQGGAAGFVSEIRGSYTNVVGLPLAEVTVRMRRDGLCR